MPKEKRWSRFEADASKNLVYSALRGYKKIELCGSYRRGLSTVADLDFVLVVDDWDEFDSSLRMISDKILAWGRRTIRIILTTGIQADFMIIGEKSFRSAVLHSTGSKWFNIKCRKRAKVLGLKLNEYGLYDRKTDKRVGSTEESILESLRMSAFLDPKRRT